MNKELEERLLAFRFSNPMLCGHWNSKNIDSMRITSREDIGIEILILMTMKEPKYFTNDGIEKAKKRVRSHLQNDPSGKFFVNNRMWRGSTFFIDTGNKISESSEGILILYKTATFIGEEISEPNLLFISINSIEKCHIYINYKVPGRNSWAPVRIPIVS